MRNYAVALRKQLSGHTSSLSHTEYSSFHHMEGLASGSSKLTVPLSYSSPGTSHVQFTGGHPPVSYSVALCFPNHYRSSDNAGNIFPCDWISSTSSTTSSLLGFFAVSQRSSLPLHPPTQTQPTLQEVLTEKACLATSRSDLQVILLLEAVGNLYVEPRAAGTT